MLRGYCDSVDPIPQSEYVDRQERLANVLPESAALVMEPGATMLYYTNIAWSLSERPFLVVLQRVGDEDDKKIEMTVVTPMFEATRAVRALEEAGLPDAIQPRIVEWKEHESPYDVAYKVLEEASHVYVEPNIRFFIYDGLVQKLTAARISIATRDIQTLRMRKSPAELAILRCANHATEAAIREVRGHVKVGMTEENIAAIMTQALETAGLTNTWVLALVDENAALPHGKPGSDKKVAGDSTVLIDTGGELLGYQSDTTRTFFMGSQGSGHNQTIVDAWYSVRRAQEAVLKEVSEGIICADVDLTARRVIQEAGFGRFFTHRLGHGIGEEMHEEPYMNQGNTAIRLQQGMTFSVEPGIYVPNEFGIRLEDIVVVNVQGQLEVLTSGLASDPWTL
ncbi:peptidase M24, structural domain-containing protein [Dichotomocladium elegans]|nr:peptidase M24, structural domain-containing protein [Dichotomocladium elegans]